MLPGLGRHPLYSTAGGRGLRKKCLLLPIVGSRAGASLAARPRYINRSSPILPDISLLQARRAQIILSLEMTEKLPCSQGSADIYCTYRGRRGLKKKCPLLPIMGSRAGAGPRFADSMSVRGGGAGLGTSAPCCPSWVQGRRKPRFGLDINESPSSSPGSADTSSATP